jgi:hypothetical protein
MNRNLAACAWVLILGLKALAAVPPPEELLPADTVAILTLPDVSRARAAAATNATGQFWADPAMRPFRDQFTEILRTEVIAPLERELGVNLTNYAGLLQGQLTLACLPTGGSARASLGWLLLADAGDQSNLMGLQLVALRKRCAAANQPVRIDRLQDIEFTTVVLSNADLPGLLARAFTTKGTATTNPGPPEAEAAGAPLTITLGQSGSLLIVATDTNLAQGVLTRLAGPPGSALRDNAAFQRAYGTRFKAALGYAWADLQPLTERLVNWARTSDAEAQDPDPKRAMPKRSKLLALTGLTDARSVSLAWSEAADGSSVEMNLGLPATNRTGIFKLIEFEAKDSGPPPFVPAEAIHFERWRLSLPNTWTTLEKMFTDAFPAANTVLDLLFQTAGKDSDPDYNLKVELLGTLGDDLITYELAPRTNTPAPLSSPPSVSLLGSTNADRLVTALKAAVTLLPPPLANVMPGELQGRKIYSLSVPSLLGTDAPGGAERNLTFAAATNFVVFSTDTNLLSTALGGTNLTAEPLRDLRGLAEAAQKVGGMGTGWFGYANTAADARRTFEALKQHPDSALALVPPTYLLAITGLHLEEPLQHILARCDFALLPAFDQVQRYYHFTVYSVSADADGFNYRMFSPLPSALRKLPEPPAAQSPSK